MNMKTHMKRHGKPCITPKWGCILGMVLAVGLAPAWGWGIEVGDPVEQVEAELGEPLAYVRVNTLEIFQFYRGRVEARDGVVSVVELMTQEEAEEMARLEAAAEAERVRRERELSALREREGLQMLQERLSNPDFMNAPAATRVASWQNFRRSYPEVALPDDYYQALQQRQADVAAMQESQRLAEMERRVAQAEARAAAAERSAANDRYTSRAYSSSSSRYYSPYAFPVVTYGGYDGYPNYRVRTPTVTIRPYHSTPGYGFQRPREPIGRPQKPRGGHDDHRPDPAPATRRTIGNMIDSMSTPPGRAGR